MERWPSSCPRSLRYCRRNAEGAQLWHSLAVALAAPPDILRPKLWKRWCAVRVVPAGAGGKAAAGTGQRSQSTQGIGKENGGVCKDGKWSEVVMGVSLVL